MNEKKVLVDTCIWSIVLRHRHYIDHPLIPEFTHLAQQKRLLMLGAIRQEVLSGMREPQRFEWLRQKLRAFPDFPVSLEDYETAAYATALIQKLSFFQKLSFSVVTVL